MLTKNFKNMMAMILERTSGYKGLLEARATNNTVYYLMGSYDSSSFPYAVAQTYTNNMNNAGIALGSGDVAATEEDYTLQAPITSGITVTVTILTGLEEDGSPYLEYSLVIANNTANTVSIREVGYIQQLYTSTVYDSTSSSGRRACLLDRTVLATPVVILAGENGVVKYRLKTAVAE